MGTTITNNLKRVEPKALAAAIEMLAARFGNLLVTSQAVREHHGHTTTWLRSQPPDAVVFPQETRDVQDTVRICVKHGVPVIAYGNFLNVVLNFIILAFVVFVMVKLINRLRRQPAPVEASPPEDTVLLREIRDALQRT